MDTMNSQFEPATNANPLGRDNVTTTKESGMLDAEELESPSVADPIVMQNKENEINFLEEEREVQQSEVFDFDPQVIEEENTGDLSDSDNAEPVQTDSMDYPGQQNENTRTPVTNNQLEKSVDEINPDINSMNSRG